MLSRKRLAALKASPSVLLILFLTLSPIFSPKVFAVTANLTEWTMPDGNTGPWGIAVDQSAKVWFTENVTNRLANLDPVTNQLREWNFPSGGADPRYVFIKGAGSSVRIYFTEYGADKVGYFDNSTGTFFEWTLPSGTKPVSVGVDNQDNIWFSESGRDAIGSITPITNTWTEYRLPATPPPSGSVQCGSITTQLCPWGITVQDVSTISGSNRFVWFTELTNNVVGRLETKSHALTLFNLATVNPINYGPMDITLDPNGNAIFTSTNVQSNRIDIIRNQTNTLSDIAIPTSNSKPTSIKWDPTRNLAWFTEYRSGKVASLDTSTAVFTFLPQVISCTIGGTNPGSPNCASSSAFLQSTVTLGTTIKSSPDQTRTVTPSIITTVASQDTNVFKEYPLPTTISGPNNVYVSSAGNIWFTEQQTSGNRIGRFSITTPVILTVSAAATTITVNQGQLANFTINVQQTAGTSVTASLSISPSPPQGVTYSFTPASGTPPYSSTLQLGTSSATPAGTYPFTVTATGGGTTAQTQINLIVTSTPVVTFDFSLSVTGSTASTVTAGDSSTFSLSVTPLGSSSPQSVQLFASGQPPGVTAGFAPATGLPPYSSTMTLSSATSTAAGTYTITVTGTGGGQTHQTSVTLTVNAPERDFSISAPSGSLTIPQASTGTTSLLVQSMGVFSDPVSLATSNLPGGVSVSFTPNPVTPNAGGSTQADVLITVQRSVPVGAYTFTITGTSGSLVRQTTFSIAVTGCLIATATYGSELSPEVQFLRDFRDYAVLKTFAGSSFMRAFNSWYYSFSPDVAGYIAAHSTARAFMRVALYPLLGVLHLSSSAYGLLVSQPEIAALTAGIIAGSLIGLVYIALPVSVLLYAARRRLTASTLGKAARYFGGLLLVLLAGVTAAELLASSSVMMIASAGIVLTFVALGAFLPAIVIVRRAARFR